MDQLVTNLVVGVVGALLGAFVAYRLQVREGRRLDKGATRAVYMELAANRTAATAAATAATPTGILLPLRQNVYTAEIARLAAYLTPSELMAVTWAYQLVPDGERAIESLRAGRGWRGDDPERAVLLQLSAELEPALALLQTKAWTQKERQALAAGVPGRKYGDDNKRTGPSPAPE